ncbi:MAG TPA: 1,2-phenylacetyl-CoA epoxidase subunit PaaC [Chitinophagaceae bacterium]|nr:1,2-phenylacetyl-CoA epoxidase subunit PaaC [Chitinophagaceae bacterium]
MNQDLVDYILHLADNALVLGHQNSKWCGHGPVLEQDIAITNISLDLVGQARNFYQYAARVINLSDNKIDPVTEDSLAYLRDTREFKNLLLLEQPNGDWAKTILRQFLFTTYQFYLYQQLQNSKDTQLAAIAEKSLKEVTYHLRWSSEWMIRLGDGTEISHHKMLAAIDSLWMYTGELFADSTYEIWAIKNQIAFDLNGLKNNWEEKAKEIFEEATLTFPGKTFMQTGGKEGRHTEHLGFILADLQFMQRAYPGCEW